MTRLSDTSAAMVAFKLSALAAYFMTSRFVFSEVCRRYPEASRQDLIMWGTFAVHSVRDAVLVRWRTRRSHLSAAMIQVVFWGLNTLLNILNLTKWPRWLYDTKIQSDVETSLREHVTCAAVVLANQVCLCSDACRMPETLTSIRHWTALRPAAHLAASYVLFGGMADAGGHVHRPCRHARPGHSVGPHGRVRACGRGYVLL